MAIGLATGISLALTALGLGLEIGGNVSETKANRDQARDNIEELNEQIGLNPDGTPTGGGVTQDAADIVSDIEDQREQLLNRQAELAAVSGVSIQAGSPLDAIVDINDALDTNIQRVNRSRDEAIDDLRALIAQNEDAANPGLMQWVVGPATAAVKAGTDVLEILDTVDFERPSTSTLEAFEDPDTAHINAQRSGILGLLY